MHAAHGALGRQRRRRSSTALGICLSARLLHCSCLRSSGSAPAQGVVQRRLAVGDRADCDERRNGGDRMKTRSVFRTAMSSLGHGSTCLVSFREDSPHHCGARSARASRTATYWRGYGERIRTSIGGSKALSPIVGRPRSLGALPEAQAVIPPRRNVRKAALEMYS
jgi:hypothetical protein